MTLDVPTLLIVTVLIASMAGGLMILSWLQNRSTPALLWWGAAYLIAAPVGALFGARGAIPDFWSIDIANALMITAAGLIWCGLRVFDGRPVAMWYAFCGSGIWLVACGYEDFYQSLHARIALSSLLSASYGLLCVLELWRSRHDGPLIRWIALGAFGLHDFVYFSRALLTWRIDIPPGGDLFKLPWLPFGLLEALFFTFASAFMLLTLSRERAEARHRQASLIDPLTGAPNRRGVFDQAAKILKLCQERKEPVTVLLFDLDHFKNINDRFGHQAGDEILISFCRAVQSRLGPEDAFGRLGGEEFVCLMPGATPQAAFATADRIRSDFENAHLDAQTNDIRATVSVGMANSIDAGSELSALFGAADKALYQAKAKGRNRVEWRRPPFAVVQGGSPLPQGAA